MRKLQMVMLSLLLLFALSKCTMTPPHEPGPPNPTPIESLRQSEFAPTLENQIPANKNVIYCPTLLFAWDVVKKSQKNPITLDASNSLDFKLLNQTISYRNSLNDNEKQVEADFSGGAITIKSFFNKNLPFQSQFQKLDTGMLFGDVKVKAFGLTGTDGFLKEFTHIAFYKDDDNFVIKINPKDSTSEILLIKGLENIKTLQEASAQTTVLIKTGEKDTAPKNSWKYTFKVDDYLSIPVVNFNIEKHYDTLEGETFVLARTKQTITEAYQKIAFTLDENGVFVESNERLETAGLDTAAFSEKPHPKHLKFDKPFYIIIEHLNRNPYFVMKVDNVELLKKQ